MVPFVEADETSGEGNNPNPVGESQEDKVITDSGDETCATEKVGRSTTSDWTEVVVEATFEEEDTESEAIRESEQQ